MFMNTWGLFENGSLQNAPGLTNLRILPRNGWCDSQFPGIPPELQAALQSAMAGGGGSTGPGGGGMPSMTTMPDMSAFGQSPAIATKSSPAIPSGFAADILAKLKQQLPATKTQSAFGATTSPPPTTTPQSPLEQLMFFKTVGMGAGGGIFGGMQNPMKMMMLQNMMGGGGGGGGGGRGGGMGGGLLRTTIQFRLCDEADLQKISCMMCDVESFRRFKMPFKFFQCNPMMPKFLPPSMRFGCCYKDMRAMMMAKQLAAR
ncbi:hypothetical protein KUTeg_000910 [Tegillarca granosa]|uniref:Uncharacterized protein n=1 Tax=Tegillarca granosa TaxID=220873 RepID=A0ABQ9FWG3_TEGGR|nr:hypothetical protein KUTeg_001062 [Tegillarca granosa]KAJ8321539.1 hypothetical protein KUTeg_000910 [Tegillarca granosa]